MAHERKASESSSPAARGNRSPIPAGKKDDLEDVSWALSTAEAMWGRGDHADGLKWLRRAAEAAAEAEADDRALELAKAAADVASLLAESRPPPPAAAIPVAPPPPLITTPSRPPPPLPSAATRTSVTGAAPSPPRVVTTASALPRSGQKTPSPPRVGQQAPISKRGGRRSSPSFSNEVTQEKSAIGRTGRASGTNEAKKRLRASRPSMEETTEAPAVSTGALAPSTATVEAWPTQALTADDDEDVYTRIGTPAYQESAQIASARPPPIPAAGAPAAGAPAASAPPAVVKPSPDASSRTSQAVRVVVWRGADGVHVAPAGTTVAAISVEAMLVALDPGADLLAWLTNK
jgi:hypothetical protein